MTAFPGDHGKDLANLEASAITSARSLASVYRRNPAWIYQGETVRQIVTDAVAMLRACGLNRAATALERATSHRQQGHSNLEARLSGDRSRHVEVDHAPAGAAQQGPADLGPARGQPAVRCT